MSAAKADKLVRAYAITQALAAITGLHEQEFQDAERPVAEAPEPVDAEALRKSFVAAARKGVSIFKRAQRRAATEDAARRAINVASQEAQRRVAQHQIEQNELDEAWAALLANDSAAVMQQLAAAFEDNAAPAAPLAVIGPEATVTVLVPDESSIPDQMPGQTAAGNLSIRKMTKKQRDELNALLISGYMLATVKEAFSVAPGLARVRILAIRSTGTSAYGKRRGEALAAALITRDALVGVHWKNVDAFTILSDVASEIVLNARGTHGTLHPLDLSREPEVARIMEVIDFDGFDDA